MTQYSIAEARDRFAQLVYQVETGSAIEVTRRGWLLSARPLNGDGVSKKELHSRIVRAFLSQDA